MSLMPDLDGDSAPLCETSGIADQVENNLANARFVAVHLRKTVGNGDL